MLFRIQEERGIVLLTDYGYRMPARVPVNERVYETGTFIQKRYHGVIVADGKPITISQTACTFLDFDRDAQRLVRLNSRGEIGKLVTILMGMVGSKAFDFVSEDLQQIAWGFWKRRAELTAGRYAFVPFVRDRFGNQIPGGQCFYFELTGVEGKELQAGMRE